MTGDHTAPSLLFKYQGVTAQSVSNLRSNTIWFSSPAGLNDPFDGSMPVIDHTLEEADIPRIYSYFRGRVPDPAHFDRTYLIDGQPNRRLHDEYITGALTGMDAILADQQRSVACFAARSDNLLMWAHYAEEHRGFCLGFDTSADPHLFRMVAPIRYVDAVPALKVIDLFTEKLPAFELLAALLLTKSREWSYEEEWRIIHKERSIAYKYNEGVLTQLYFGARMTEENKALLKDILKGTGTKVFQMRTDVSHYAVVAEPVG